MKDNHLKRESFIKFIASTSDTELNDYIKRHGKKPKPVRLYRLIDNPNAKVYHEQFTNDNHITSSRSSILYNE